MADREGNYVANLPPDVRENSSHCGYKAPDVGIQPKLQSQVRFRVWAYILGIIAAIGASVGLSELNTPHASCNSDFAFLHGGMILYCSWAPNASVCGRYAILERVIALIAKVIGYDQVFGADVDMLCYQVFVDGLKKLGLGDYATPEGIHNLAHCLRDENRV